MSELGGFIFLIFGLILVITSIALITRDDEEIPLMAICIFVFPVIVLLFYTGFSTVIEREQEKTAIGLLNNEIQVDTIAVSPQGKVLKVKLIDVK